jgi:hypothetical protein
MKKQKYKLAKEGNEHNAKSTTERVHGYHGKLTQNDQLQDIS